MFRIKIPILHLDKKATNKVSKLKPGLGKIINNSFPPSIRNYPSFPQKTHLPRG